MGLLQEEVFLYTPQGGRSDLRHAWRNRILSQTRVPISLPVVCCGLTHGLSICADLFIDANTDVILPSPRWGNYDMVFGIRRNIYLIPDTVTQDILKNKNATCCFFETQKATNTTFMSFMIRILRGIDSHDPARTIHARASF